MNNIVISKEQIFEIWVVHLKEPKFYKSMIPKKLSKIEWYNQVDIVLNYAKERKKLNLPFSEHMLVVKLYRIFHQ